MTQTLPAATASDRVAKLHGAAALVSRMSGNVADMNVPGAETDEAYDALSTLARARFDDLADQVVALASAGLGALLSGTASPAAISRLAEEMDREIVRLEAMLAA